MYSVMDIMDALQTNISTTDPGDMAIFLPFKRWERRRTLDVDVEVATMICEDGRKFLVTIQEVE